MGKLQTGKSWIRVSSKNNFLLKIHLEFGNDLWNFQPDLVPFHKANVIKILKCLIIKMLNPDLNPTEKLELVLQIESGQTEG